MDKNIVLIGFMAVGKTTVGTYLAAKSKMKFVDTDRLIEERYQLSVAEIFEKYGEEEFRKAEKQVAEELSQKKKLVIATGGGMVKSQENMDFLRKNAVVVYLSSSVDKIINNAGQTGKRPLLVGKTREQIVEMIRQRQPYYEQCDLKIDVTHLTAQQTADKILSYYLKSGNEEKHG